MTAPAPDQPSPHGALIGAAVCVALIAISAIVQAAGGAYEMTAAEALGRVFDPAVWGHPGTLLHLVLGDELTRALGAPASGPLSTETLIVWSVRLPRLLAGALVGINLAISGTIFQGITRNELASPYTLGVGSGSGLAIWGVLVVFPSMGVHLPLCASVGGALAFLVTYVIAWNRGTDPVRLVLAGVIVSAIAGSFQSALFFLARDITVIHDAASWTVGSLSGAGWAHVRLALPWTLLSITLALAGSRHLDILLLGDATSRALGLPVERARFLLAAVAILAAATSVSIAGHVGFVGLIVPHIVRNTTGHGHKQWLLGGLLAGPALLMSADAVARLALSPIQVPVGVVTGVLGGIYFLHIMRRRRELGQV